MAHDGSYVIELGRSAAAGKIMQVLVPPLYHPSLSITFNGWARVVPDLTQSAPGPAGVTVLVTEGGRKAASEETRLDPSGRWMPLSAEASISESADQVTVSLNVGQGAGSVQFDDMSAEVKSLQGPWTSPVSRLQLVNPSAEVASLGLRPAVARFLPREIRQMAAIVANPQPFDKQALWAGYAGGQYRSFWGNFGWLSIPLPDGVYMALDALVLIALAGLAWRGVRLRMKWSAGEWLGLLSLLSLLAALLIGFIRQMTLLATIGVAAYPQGRYLFVLIIPVAWLVIVGIWEVWALALVAGGRVRDYIRSRGARPAALTRHSEVQAGKHPAYLSWAVWLWCNALVLFGGYCLLGLIAPYYYG